jgi:type IV pilus assembly protein PilA
MRRAFSAQQGFTLVELLIVIIIVGVLAAIAIPVYIGQRGKAKEASLKESARIVLTETTTLLASPGLSTTYNATAGNPGTTAYNTAAATYRSNALEAALKNGSSTSNGEGIRNTFSARPLVLNQASTSLTGTSQNPAVFITNATALRYASFQTQTAATRNLFRGSVIVCWNTLAAVNAVEIYTVNNSGTKSTTVATVSLAP